MFRLSKKQVTNNTLLCVMFTVVLSTLFLSGCDTSNSDGDSSDVGYIQFYNASPNAPAIFLTVDEDLDEDDDDEVERTYSSVAYANSSGLNELENGDYFIELAWQDEDSSAREDLAIIYQDQVAIDDENISLYVLAEDIASPVVFKYDVPVIDDDDDDTDDLFNIRFLNLHATFGSVDIYASKSDETFNEAVLVGSSSYAALTDNVKLEQDEYTFYLTASGNQTVLFESSEVSFQYSSQYVLTLRENLGVDSTPFVVDLLTNSSTVEYQHQGAQARFRVFNAIQEHELIPNYAGAIDVYSNTSSSQADISNLTMGQFSEAIDADYGDYSFAVTLPDSQEQLLKNHLVTLGENADKTIFFYISEEYVDDDNDGNVDEDGDGIVDQIELYTNSLVVTNSTYQGLYEHNVNIVNLIDDEDFGVVDVYFVRSDELIETAENKRSVVYTTNESISLLNNTYTVFVVATVNSSEVLLGESQITLNEDSEEMFLILEQDASSSVGYKMTFANQTQE